MTMRDEKTGKFYSAKSEELSLADQIKAAEDKLLALKQEKAKKDEEEKAAKSLARKNEALKVQNAFTELNAAKRTFNESRRAAEKEYIEEVNNARKKYNDTLTKIAEPVTAAQESYNKAFAEFTKAHPEGYHLSLKDGDNVQTISKTVDKTSDLFSDFVDLLLKNF